MTVSDILKNEMITDNKPVFIWIRNGTTTGEHVNVNHIISVEPRTGFWGHGVVTLNSGMQVKFISLNEWDTADNVMRKIQVALNTADEADDTADEADDTADEEEERIANDPVRLRAEAADGAKANAEFALIFKVGCWLFFFLFLVYGLSMWLVVPMVDGPKRKAEEAQSTADAAQRSADDAYSSALDAQSRADEEARRIADGNGQIGIRMSQSQGRADAAQSQAVEAHSDGNGQIGIRMSQSQGRASEAQRKADEAKQKQSP